MTTIDGGDGIDTLVLPVVATADALVSGDFSHISNIEILTLANTSSSVTLGTGGQTAGILTVNGGTGQDTIDGSAYTVSINLVGGAESDVLTGGSAADTIIGGAGNDTIVGNSGDDSITGGEGSDSITGGAGNDRIVLTETTADRDTVKFESTAAANGVDTITGFVAGLTDDKLDFTAFLGVFTIAGYMPYTANPGISDVVGHTSVVLCTDISGGQDISTATGLTTALTTNGEYANIDALSSSAAQYVFLTNASSTATTYNVFFADSANGSNEFANIALVGTFTTTDTTNLNGNNFV